MEGVQVWHSSHQSRGILCAPAWIGSAPLILPLILRTVSVKDYSQPGFSNKKTYGGHPSLAKLCWAQLNPAEASRVEWRSTTSLHSSGNMLNTWRLVVISYLNTEVVCYHSKNQLILHSHCSFRLRGLTQYLLLLGSEICHTPCGCPTPCPRLCSLFI